MTYSLFAARRSCLLCPAGNRQVAVPFLPRASRLPQASTGHVSRRSKSSGNKLLTLQQQKALNMERPKSIPDISKLQQRRFKPSTTDAAVSSNRILERSFHQSTSRRQKATLAAGSRTAARSGQSNMAARNTRQQQQQQQRQEDIEYEEIRKSLYEALEEFLRKPRTIPIPRWISPTHFTVTFSECFGHASFMLVFCSYAVDDYFLLRIIAVAGSTAMLFFTYFHPHGRVLWLPFKWNAAFIAINSYRIGLIYFEHYWADQLSPELLDLRKRNFYLMSPIDFAKLMRLGKIEEYKRGDILVTQGTLNRKVRLVLSGEFTCLRDGKITYNLEEGNFVSEAGLHSGLLLSGEIESCCTVIADSDSARVLTWDRTELTDLMAAEAGVRRTVKAVLSWDIVRKLKAQRILLASGAIDDPEEWTERRNDQTLHRYAAILSNILDSDTYHVDEWRMEINKYRMIHHIDDEHHAKAVEMCGWTMEEFERGVRHDHDTLLQQPFWEYVLHHYILHDHPDDAHHVKNWRMYLRDVYWRITGKRPPGDPKRHVKEFF